MRFVCLIKLVFLVLVVTDSVIHSGLVVVVGEEEEEEEL